MHSLVSMLLRRRPPHRGRAQPRLARAAIDDVKPGLILLE